MCRLGLCRTRWMRTDPAVVPHGMHASLFLLRQGFWWTCRASQDMVWRSRGLGFSPYAGFIPTRDFICHDPNLSGLCRTGFPKGARVLKLDGTDSL